MEEISGWKWNVVGLFGLNREILKTLLEAVQGWLARSISSAVITSWLNFHGAVGGLYFNGEGTSGKG